MPNKHTLDDDEHNWPDGFCRRKYVKGTEVRGVWTFNKWAWRNHGPRKYEGDSKALLSECLGLFICSNSRCSRRFRPKTKEKERRAQLNGPCPACNVGRIIPSDPPCPAKNYTFTYSEIDETYRVWDHIGAHNHPRLPEDGYFSVREKERVVDAVQRNPTATAHRLRKTGGDAPGSEPLTKISKALHDQSRVRYQVDQAQKVLGYGSGTVSGGFNFLQKLFELNSKLGEPFIVDSGFHDICFIQFQTPFMEEAIKRTVDEWLEMDPQKDAKHGFVTDGNHSFFKAGVLLTTSIFDITTLAWIPVLYTWILNPDEKHHLPHFQRINAAIIQRLKELGIPIDPKFLLNVSYTGFFTLPTLLTCSISGLGFLCCSTQRPCSCICPGCGIYPNPWVLQPQSRGAGG